jgi:hypothetical protein
MRQAESILRRVSLPGLLKVTLSVAFAVSVVVVQFFLTRDFPIHFAPALLVTCFASWYFGAVGGIFAEATAALAVNYLLLGERAAWSFRRADALATLSFLMLASVALSVIASIRSTLSRMDAELRHAKLAADAESRHRKSAEEEFSERLKLFDSEIAGLRKYVDSYESSKRFARVAQTRLAELRTAIEQFPLPIALIAEEDGMPVIRLASTSFFELASYPRSMAVFDAFENVVSTNLQPFEGDLHPLFRALKGETVSGELVVLRGQSESRRVQLYIKPVVDGRFLAVAFLAEAQSLRSFAN